MYNNQRLMHGKLDAWLINLTALLTQLKLYRAFRAIIY